MIVFSNKDFTKDLSYAEYANQNSQYLSIINRFINTKIKDKLNLINFFLKPTVASNPIYT